MNLNQRQWRKVLSVIQHLSDGLDDTVVRETAGHKLLDLLSADHFASYIWDQKSEAFTKPVYINMSPENLSMYEQYYQFRDPITHKMQNFRRAVAVNEVMPQRELLGTEFFNDFLRRDGLHYGINIYVYDEAGRNIGDFRIWRSRKRDDFSNVDLGILDLIAPYFRNAMRNISLARQQPPYIELEGIVRQLKDTWLLTRREIDVALAMLDGNSDKVISDQLFISLSTLRTHIQHIYNKLGVGSRAEFCNRLVFHSEEYRRS